MTYFMWRVFLVCGILQISHQIFKFQILHTETVFFFHFRRAMWLPPPEIHQFQLNLLKIIPFHTFLSNTHNLYLSVQCVAIALLITRSKIFARPTIIFKTVKRAGLLTHYMLSSISTQMLPIYSTKMANFR